MSTGEEEKTVVTWNEGDYLKSRLAEQIQWYDDKSGWNKWWFFRLRCIEIISAAIIPLLSGFVSSARPCVPIAIGILGVVIAVCAGIGSVYQLQERWTEYRTTAESLKKEQVLFLTKVDPYDNERAFPLLVQRVEALVSKENTNWARIVTKAGKEGHQRG